MAGRPSKTKALAVWMNGEQVGQWRFSTTGGHAFSYEQSWLDSPQGRPLSLSLPLAQATKPFTGPRVEAYFDNLLPDSLVIRKRVAARFSADSVAAFSLLEKIGRDCVGAVQLLPVDAVAPDVRRIDATPLSESDIERLLDDTVAAQNIGASDEDALRISIAGAQEKTALLWHQGQWCRPHGATPTTHILKLPLGEVGGQRADFSTSVENEWICAQIVKTYGLPVANSEIASFGRHKVLIVTRFDRRLLDNRWWACLPQEDFCQVHGVSSEKKYEENGGPGMSAILDTLRGSENAEEDRRQFLAVQLLFWMLAAPDGHAKNFSLFLESRGRFRLTPFYDIMSAWPVIGKGARQIQWKKIKLAMALRGNNAHYRMADIQRRHWNLTAKSNFMGSDFEPVIQHLINITPAAIEAVAAQLPAGFPVKLSGAIFDGIRAQARRLEIMGPGARLDGEADS